MKYFAVFLPMKDKEKSAEHRPAHLEFLEKMKEEKKVLMNGKFSDGSGGLVIYRASDEDEAISYLKQDPFVETGARDWEIHEWELETASDVQIGG
ncbi:YciI family protein [Salsuginibacillus kocurii]|uniref:YciI family protein n=1 Tax=Salsuginibacillus kocurii TaxID=427078 RepID=UPI00036F8CDF|nr:YciI family protein [Salsuginibacillus kocurii]